MRGLDISILGEVRYVQKKALALVVDKDRTMHSHSHVSTVDEPSNQQVDDSFNESHAELSSDVQFVAAALHITTG
jgi:TFIIF-interacting CTD phosphatase-like protein